MTRITRLGANLFVVVIFGAAAFGAIAFRHARSGSDASPAIRAAPRVEVDSAPLPLPPPDTAVASWYGKHWQGRKTASGKRFEEKKLTAAHRTLPLNEKVRVTNLLNDRSVDVTIDDRGPYISGRDIDLSQAAAQKLGMVKDGLAPVAIEPLDELPAAPATGVKTAER